MKTFGLRSFLFALLCSLATPLASIGQDARLRVVTLHTVLTEICREVGGSHVEVAGLVRPGVDPHGFDPSPSDMRSVVEADLVVAAGLHLEPYLDRLVRNVGTKARVLAAGDALPPKLILRGDVPHGTGEDQHVHPNEVDPHWWHSIENVVFVTEQVRLEYSRQRPAWTENFTRQAEAYTQRLRALETWARVEMAQLPPAKRHLVTAHDAFGYLARDYGFTIHPLNGLSTEGEPNAKRVATLIRFIRREKIAALFTETTAGDKIVRNVMSETGARRGGMLYADGLGPSESDGATYEAMYRHNVRTIVAGLSGR